MLEMRSAATEVSPSDLPRDRTVRLAGYEGSIVGFAAAWVLGSAIPVRPPANPLPGYAAQHGLDVRRQITIFVLLVALPILGGAAAVWWERRRRGDRAAPAPTDVGIAPRHWEQSPLSRLAVVCAHALTLWVFVCALFPGAERPLLPFLSVFAVSAALGFLLDRMDPGRGILSLGAASPVLFLPLTGQRPIPFSREAAVAAIALPVLTCALGRRRSGSARFRRALTAGVLLPGSIMAFAAGAVLGAPTVADIFEDGHALLPASEYLRGELPYRDVVPGHGLLSDGLFHAAGMKALGDDYRGFARASKLLGVFFWPSFYAIGLAATANPATAFCMEALSFAVFPQFSFPRLIASAFTLALALYASRTGRTGAWLACGAAIVVTFFFTVDFATYSAAAALTALLISRGDRRRSALAAVGGACAAAAAAAVALGAFGLLRGFARTTFVYLPSLLPAYAQGFPSLPVVPGALDETPAVPMPFFYGLIALSVILLGAELPSGGRISDRARAALPVLAWIVASMLSVAERRHVGYTSYLIPAALVLLARWLWAPGTERPLRALAASGALAAVLVAHRPVDLFTFATLAIQSPPSPPDRSGPLDEPRRARGAFFRLDDRTLVRKTAEMMRRAGFRDGDTWLDFGNAPGLYFLFERPCPIRYYEPAFYESEEAQREVVDAIDRNPHVRAALIIGSYAPVDGIPNAVRAPHVDRYLREHFRPFLVEDGVEFWLRVP